MIDVVSEKLLTLEDAARMLLVDKTTVFRWITIGSKGLKLEGVKLGSSWRTSEEAIQRFAEAGTPNQNEQKPELPNPRTLRQQQKHFEAVDRSLEDLIGPRRCEECRTPIDAPKGSIRKDERVWCPSCLIQRKSATLGQRVKTFRCAQSLSQSALAALTGIGTDKIRAFEFDEKYPSEEQLSKLVDALGADLIKGLKK